MTFACSVGGDTVDDSSVLISKADPGFWKGGVKYLVTKYRGEDGMRGGGVN